jgi:hypothetical protein
MLGEVGLRHYVRVMLVILCVGVFATLSMDAWNAVLDMTDGITLDWHLMGRWVLDWFSGDMIMRHIQTSPSHAHDGAMGWVAHYATGVVYAYLYFILVISLFHKRNTWLHAVFFSFCFMLMPFLLYQPAVGMGYFGDLTAHPDKVRIVTLSFHAAFGTGLFFATCLAQKWLKRFDKTPKVDLEKHLDKPL